MLPVNNVGFVWVVLIPFALFLLAFVEAQATICGVCPKIEYLFPFKAYPKNSSLLVVSTTMGKGNPVRLDFVCQAVYPIYWKFSLQPEVDETSTIQHIMTNRKGEIEDFDKPLTYTYQIFATIEFHKGLEKYPNISCTAFHNGNLVTSIAFETLVDYDDDKDNKLGLILPRLSHPSYEQLAPEQEDKTVCTARAFWYKKDNYPCFRCFSAQPGLPFTVDPTPYFVECNSFETCQNLFPRVQKDDGTCMKERADSEDQFECSTTDYGASVLVCLTSERKPLMAQMYWHPVDDVDGTTYFKSEFDPSSHIKMTLRNQTNVFLVDDTVSWKCDILSTIFSRGPVLTYERNGNRYDVDRFSNYTNGINVVENQKDNQRYFLEDDTVVKSAGNYTFTCFAPYYNSRKWENVSITVSVLERTPEIVDLSRNLGNSTFKIGQKGRSLICSFKGVRVSSVVWLLNEKQLLESTSIDVEKTKENLRLVTSWESGTSWLQIFNTSLLKEGYYTCKVSSGRFFDRKSIEIWVDQVEQRGDSTSTTTIVLISVAAILIIPISMILILYVVRRPRLNTRASKRAAMQPLTEFDLQQFLVGEMNTEMGTTAPNSAAYTMPYNTSYELERELLLIDYDHPLGHGQYGSVYLGKLRPNVGNAYCNIMQQNSEYATEVSVAVKTISPVMDKEYFKALLSEIKVVAFLGRHPNVVSLVGAVTANILRKELLLVSELCQNGSLETYLKRNKNDFQHFVEDGLLKMNKIPANQAGNSQQGQFTTRNLLEWTKEIANGLVYIQEKKVIHGDLAIRNILLTESLVAKIGDFGLSRMLLDSGNYIKKTQVPLPWRNMAPESLGERNFSLKSDIWAFGVTLWEMYSLAKTPYSGTYLTIHFTQALEKGLRLPMPLTATNEIFEFLLSCWQIKPENRPGPENVLPICSRASRQIDDVTT